MSRIFALVALAMFMVGCSSNSGPVLVAVDRAETDNSAFVVGDQPVVEESTQELLSPDLDVVTDSQPQEADAEDESGNDQSSNVPLVIFDTDIGPDVDDVLALAMLHGYQKQGLIEIAAVTISRDTTRGAQYADVVNTFYGRPDIPIGIYRGGTVKPFDDAGSFVSRAPSWTTDVGNQSIPDGYRLIRQILADNEGTNRKILIVQTGFAGNTSALVNNGGDDISPKSGIDLINGNNTLLVYAGGSLRGSRAEFNFENDISSARNLFAKWPGQIVLSPFEIGEQILYPYTSIQNDFNWVDRHPVREAYEHRDLSWHQDAPPYYNMRSWDLTAVMLAVEPSAGFFPTTNGVSISVNDNGTMSYQVGGGKHILVDRPNEYTDGQRQRIVNRMIELTRHQP